MLEFQCANLPTLVAPTRRIVPIASRAARAQRSGFNRLDRLFQELSSSSIESTSSTSTAAESNEPDRDDLERRARLENERTVDRELARYEDEGIVDETHPDGNDFDLVRYWQVRIPNFTIAYFNSIRSS